MLLFVLDGDGRYEEPWLGTLAKYRGATVDALPEGDGSLWSNHRSQYIANGSWIGGHFSGAHLPLFGTTTPHSCSTDGAVFILHGSDEVPRPVTVLNRRIYSTPLGAINCTAQVNLAEITSSERIATIDCSPLEDLAFAENVSLPENTRNELFAAFSALRWFEAHLALTQRFLDVELFGFISRNDL